MTAESNLPEELLVVILNCALTTPDSEFCRFPTPEQTCLPKLHSEILLVSKRWHRIGAPLLYARLRLATPEHVNAASVALKRHLDLGRAVRTLRLEGGYGEGLREIAKLLPNAECLYVSLGVSGNIYGLGSALQSLNPKIVYVYSTRDGREESRLQREVKRLIDVAIMMQWASLKYAVFSRAFNITSDTAIALSQVPTLEAVTLTFDDNAYDISISAQRKHNLNSIAENKSVRAIICRGPGAKRAIAVVAKFEKLNSVSGSCVLPLLVCADAEGS